MHPIVVGLTPYNVAIVEFVDADKVRIASNIIDARARDLKIGMPLTLKWQCLAHVNIPRFSKVANQ
jgi:uncharacterized OB-fold protein